MYCQRCGEKLAEAAHFCSNCGVKVVQQNETEKIDENHSEQTSTDEDIKNLVNEAGHGDASGFTHKQDENEITDQEREYNQDNNPSIQEVREASPSNNNQSKSQNKFFAILPILLPILSIFIVGGGAIGYYLSEIDTNEAVLSLQQSAEKAAISGDYNKAEKELKKAQNLRPDYDVIEQNLQVIQRAATYTNTLVEIDENIKKHNYDQAEADLTSLRGEIDDEIAPLFASFPEKLEEKDVIITIGKVKEELDSLQTVDQLANKLNMIVTLPEKEAASVKDQIITKIVQITSDTAEEQLKDKKFSDATATVNQGLEYATENEKLLSFKERIKQEQAAFERAEQERIEKAMEAAAKEDLQNRTAAVNVSGFEVMIDAYGDLYLYGDITNVATRDIYSVTIYYSVYDVENNVLFEDSTVVFPNYLSPGDQGSFEDVIYSVYEEVNVEITNITWYLD